MDDFATQPHRYMSYCAGLITGEDGLTITGTTELDSVLASGGYMQNALEGNDVCLDFPSSNLFHHIKLCPHVGLITGQDGLMINGPTTLNPASSTAGKAARGLMEGGNVLMVDGSTQLNGNLLVNGK